MKKQFPIDVLSVKEFGIDYWYEHLSIWPVHDKEALRIKDDIQRMYIKLIETTPPEIQDCLIALFKLTIKYENIIHISLVIDRLNKSGYDIKFQSNSDIIFDKEKRCIDKNKLEMYIKKGLWYENESTKKRIIGKLKAFLNQLRFGIRRGFAIIPCKNPYLSIQGPPTNELHTFAENQKKKIKFIFPYNLIPQKKFYDTFVEFLPSVKATLHQGISEIVSKYGVPLGESDVELISALSVECIVNIFKEFKEIKRYFNGKKSTSVLLTSLGIISTRVVAIAALRCGQKVIGAIHGNNVGMVLTRTIALIDFPIVNIYLVPTNGSATVYKQLKNNTPYVNKTDIQIVSTNTDKYRMLYLQNMKMNLPATIRSVMLVEYPLTETRYDDVLAYWPYQLELMIRIGKILQKHKLKAIMKLHPDRMKESKGLYNSSFDEIITERFESIADRADAYILTNIGTTTFGFMVTTNRPIILFSSILSNVPEKILELLCKRCRIIPSIINDESKLVFGEDALYEALNMKNIQPNIELLENYMF